ncbi:DUF5695 domain-containing protein [Wenyingzhuangia marina]|uniref:Uncharacterized protein n=1 Tax=Wenyingzhuangia marina TaxID=1195760 RepID=A0A1M5WZX4_9FLAO|nr:DUF5695 domain-containing protein [Wenyingzhuangia marina]GGF82931.1 hypothetical protein GCM10011397_27370 [Wenyingzhuangia marina]SHH92828.1 hypothetical protein SAMN05444281_2763 [Wenyingzhuangia marina]
MKINIKYSVSALLFLCSTLTINAQGYWDNIKQKKATLGITESDSILSFETPDFQLKLVKASQTVAELRPNQDLNFDFTPSDRLKIRDKDGLYHLGDINLRIKSVDGDWKSYSTAKKRVKVTPIKVSGNILSGADLANTLPKDIPVTIKRFYEVIENQLVLRFEISNKSASNIEIGALGIPMIFNNILEGKSLTETHAQNVFFDPYIGLGAGYLEVKKLSGKGPVLLVMPKENMDFEAYRPLLDDPTRRSIVFEGFHEWMAYSKAYAEKEWKGVEQWNKPTSLMLKSNETKEFSLKFVLSKGVKNIQETIVENGQPSAISIPGYVLPKGVDSHLFLNYKSDVASFEIEPKKAIKIKKNGLTEKGVKKYTVCGNKWGRARLTINYKDGVKQTINYKIIKSESEVIKDFGHFLTTEQWFNEPDPIFKRNPSVISYDYETKKQLTQDSRAWVAGLSDEGGAGGWLAAIMKQLVQPDKEEIKKLEQFVDHTLWGNIQYSEGKHKYGVKKSVFYYEPDSLPKGTYRDDVNYKTWAAWDHKHANDPGRSYNYPHVAAAYWVMYRLARYHKGLVDNRTWDWYLKQAYHTSVAMLEQAPYYSQFGQMEGSVFLYLLKDLKTENYTEMALDLEARMKKRANHWKELDYPFGSEMPWDSTGQEEVYMWSDYFGYNKKANVTLDAILAYMPTIPHWAYNGNARRYWDFLYGGKLSRVERQIHHYGSSLNAIPVLHQYRKTNDLYLLKVGYGGLLGGISNITQDGFGSAAFHSYPTELRIDYLSGDYGSGFYGYAVNSATYITKDENLGWLAFGGNLSVKKEVIEVEVTTAAKSKVYIAPKNLWLTLDSGTFKKIIYNLKTQEVKIILNKKDEFTPDAYLRVNKEVKLPYTKIRGAFKIPLSKKETIIKI